MGKGWQVFRAMAAVFAIAFAVSAAPARASFDPFLEIRVAEALAEGRDGEAVALLKAAAETADDRNVRADATERLAALLSQLGRHAEAGAEWRALAHLISAREGELAPRLIAVWDSAARDYAAAGLEDDAADALARALEITRTAGLPAQGEGLAARLRAIAEATPDDELAEAIAVALAAHESALAEEGEARAFPVDPIRGFATVRVYYATDRARTGSDAPADFYGGGRGELELGIAEVSIPGSHKPGRIETPSIWTLDFREDPERHVVLAAVTPGEPEEVFAAMRGHLSATGSTEAFVFVHGFNVPFSEAAQRTAQIAYDMNFDGLPILYSWPSRGSVLSYISDTAVVNLSGRRLSLFLEDVVASSGATRVHLIGHSMGNRALTDALELFALRHRGDRPAFDQVLFTAPDLDAGLFAEMMRTIRPTARRATLYASDKDWALAVSRRLHGDAPRAGQAGREIAGLAEVDSIDMTDVGEDMLAHGYYANNPSALTDILSLFWRDAPPDDRCGMVREEGENGVYWRYVPDECDSGALLSTLSFLKRGGVATVAEARAFVRRFILPVTIDERDRVRIESVLSRLFGGT